MNNVVSIMFKGSRREYYHNALELPFAIGDYAVVEVEKGENMGVITQRNLSIDEKLVEKDRSILRKGNTNDIRKLQENREREDKAYEDSLKKVKKHGLDMKITDVEYQIDRKKLTFYFTADERIDFRELVRTLAGKYRTRIELRQIGPRDEAKRHDGCGVCGLRLCCSSWMPEFKPINTQMAKEQALPINPSRLAGVCGRLKCCLRFEHDFYSDAMNHFPKVGTKFATDKGTVEVAKVDIFRELIYVRYPTEEWEAVKLDDFNNKFSTLSAN